MKYSFKSSAKWSVFIFVVTYILSCVFTVVSTTMLEGVGWGVGVLIVFMFVLIGVVFDMMGLAAASAQERPFHAMASEKVKGAKQSIYIVRNADRFSNFCNDVVGDVAGVISGAASALVVLKLFGSAAGDSFQYTLFSVLFTGLVSAVTVGGKALGKSFAIHYATEIVLTIGKLFYLLEVYFRIRLFNGRKAKSNGKRGHKRAAKPN